MRWRVVTEVGRAFGEDKVPRLASSIAFTAIFSIAPLFIVLIAAAGWVLGAANGGHGHHIAEDALLEQVRKAAGPATAETVRQLVAASFENLAGASPHRRPDGLYSRSARPHSFRRCKTR